MGIVKTIYGNVCNKIEPIYDKVYNIIKAVNLKQPEKSKLVEILLIVGSITTAFKAQPDNMATIFMLFLMSSIIYYIYSKRCIAFKIQSFYKFDFFFYLNCNTPQLCCGWDKLQYQLLT